MTCQRSRLADRGVHALTGVPGRPSAVRLAGAVGAAILILTVTAPTAPLFAQPITEIIDSTGDGTNGLDVPWGVAVDSADNVYVAGTGSNNWVVGPDLSETGATASSQIFLVSDSSWKYSETMQPGWEGLGFDDSSWSTTVAPTCGLCGSCELHCEGSLPEFLIAERMWGANPIQFQTLYFRKTFVIDDLAHVGAVPIQTLADDDHDLYINGTLIASDWDGGAGPVLTRDLRPYLQTGGVNVIAIRASDSWGFCQGVCVEAGIDFCGNGNLDPGEQCDDGNLTDGDSCDSNCTPTGCGNGILTDGEQCDDGNVTDGDGCDSNCTPTGCGNGILTDGEECDDGNRISTDGCTNACTVCGNGIVTLPEACDDGNLIDGDGCNSGCKTRAAAAGVVGTGTPESCTEAALDAALDAALAGGGLVTFDCGAEPVTIILTAEKVITEDDETIVDGDGLVTLSGGGAVRIFRVDESGTLEVRNLTIADGFAGDGGGIFNRGMLTVTNSTFSGNHTVGEPGKGGGISNEGTLTVTNSTFSGNHSFGGAFGGGYGGGISNWGMLTITNCTFSGNGSGIFGFGGTLTVTNTMIANSTEGNDCDISYLNESPADGGHNLIEDADNSCGLTNGENGNIVGVDPMLDPAGLTDNGGLMQTIALLPDSPAIDAGDPEVCTNPPVNGLDQRGYVRPGVGHTVCSIGAYEADAIPVSACVGDCDGDAMVAVEELILGVDIALGEQPVGACPAFRNSDGVVDIAQLITAVNNALGGCAAG